MCIISVCVCVTLNQPNKPRNPKDLVTQQFASLLYPPFEEESIKKEELQFKTDSQAKVTMASQRGIFFSTSGLYKWIATTGANFVDLVDFRTRGCLDIKYSMHSEILYGNIIYIYTTKQAAIAKIMRGDIGKYTFFAAKERHNEAALDDPSNDIYIYGIPYLFRESLLHKNNRRRCQQNTSLC